MALEQKQAAELLTIPVDGALQHVAVSAPTTPPRIAPHLVAENLLVPALPSEDGAGLSRTDKRKSVTYSSVISQSPENGSDQLAHGSIARPAGAKSMPGSRRPSSGSQNSEELKVLVDGLSIHDRAPGSARLPHGSIKSNNTRIVLEHDRVFAEPVLASHMNVGHMLDQQLDREMQSE